MNRAKSAIKNEGIGELLVERRISTCGQDKCETVDVQSISHDLDIKAGSAPCQGGEPCKNEVMTLRLSSFLLLAGMILFESCSPEAPPATPSSATPATSAAGPLVELRAKAEKGDAKAQNKLALCYEEGDGVTKDVVEAAKWYGKAAESGYADAQFNLGLCYRDGVGVTKNAADAVKWFQKAADQNFAEAQFNLGVCYDDGEGVTKDAVQALKWYSLAADQKNENAAKYSAELQKVMTPDQIAEAQKLKKEFKPKSAQ